jgi:hypothetical protein
MLKWFCLISNLSQTQFYGPYRCQHATPTYSSSTINSPPPPVSSGSLGMEFFRTCMQTTH